MTDKPERVRIVLADDMAAFRTAYSALIRQKLGENFELVGEAVNGLELIRMTEALKPHIILVDLLMPVVNGIDAIRKIRETNSTVKIIVLTTVMERAVIENIYHLIDSYLFKETEDVTEILESIQSVAFYSSPSFKPYISKIMHGNSDAGNKEELTFREFELMLFVRKGMLNKEIAAQMFLSEKAVEKKLSVLFKKLGINNRKQLERAMAERGFPFREKFEIY